MGIFNSQFDSRAALDTKSNQGVYTDGTDFWTTSQGVGAAHQKSIHRYNSSFVLQLSRDVSGDMPAGATQVNGITQKTPGGNLFVGANNHPTIPEAGWIMEFDPITLAHVATHDVGDEACEGGAWRGEEFFAIYHSANITRRYNSSFVLQQQHTLGYANKSGFFYQGAFWIGDYFFCNLHNRVAWPHTCDVYFWNGAGFDQIGRMPYPTYEGNTSVPTATDRRSGQGIVQDPNGEFMYWAERKENGNEGDDPHNIVKSTLNSTPHQDHDTFTDTVLALNNLLFYLKLREKTGVILTDETINNNDFTMKGSGMNMTTSGEMLGPTTESLGRGIALQESVTLEKIHDASFSFGAGASFSFGMFVYVQRLVNPHWLFGKGGVGEIAADNHNYLLGANFLGLGKFDFIVEESNGANHLATSTTTVEEGKVYFVVCVRDATLDELKIYINGVLEHTNTDVFTANTNVKDLAFNTFNAGALPITASYIFEPFFTSDVITPSEVLDLWDASILPPVIGSALLLETGDALLLETGDRLLLENSTVVVPKSTIFKHNLTQAISKQTIFTHNIIQAISKNTIFQHNIIQAISKNTIFQHNILSALLQVTKTTLFQHNIIQAIPKSTIFKHNLKTAVTKSTIFKHNIQSALIQVSKSTIFQHKLISPITKSTIFKHNIGLVASNSRKILGSLKSFLGISGGMKS